MQSKHGELRHDMGFIGSKSTAYRHGAQITGEGLPQSRASQQRKMAKGKRNSMDMENRAESSPYIRGFPSLAYFIATDEDRTTAIYKRFQRLGARHLLHLQSQLADAEAELDQFDREQLTKSLEEKQYSRNWKDFCEAAEHEPRQKQQKVLLDNIGRLLQEHRKALSLESHLASLPSPTKRTLEAFKYEFYNYSSGTPYPTLGGNSSTLYDDPLDLVALRSEDRDRLTAFLQDRCSWIFKTKKSHGDVIYASDRHVARFVAILSTINAAALLVGAIASLHAIRSANKKIGIIALFTALFAVNVGILTNARRTELFAATAAYAAVLVVFVSGNIEGELPDREL